MSSEGRARYIAARKLILRALVLVSWMHYSSDGAGLKSFYFKMYSSQNLVERVARKTSEQVTVCVLSTRMSWVFKAERTRQRGLLPLREESGQKEEFFYGCSLLYSIDFSGRLDVHTFHCNENFETYAREMQQKVRSHAEKRFRMPRLWSTRAVGCYHAPRVQARSWTLARGLH